MKTKATGSRSGLSLSDEIIDRDPNITYDMATEEYRNKLEKYFRSKKYEEDAKKYILEEKYLPIQMFMLFHLLEMNMRHIKRFLLVQKKDLKK